MTELPPDAYDRIQRVLLDYDGCVISEVAHQVLKALTANLPACGMTAEHDPHPYFYGWPRESGQCGGTTRQEVGP
jgi:hypothetical protein